MTRTLAVLLACLLYSSSAIAEGGGLDDFLHNLNVQAQANPEGFSATLSSQFRVSGTEVRVVLGAAHDPADAFMVLQLGQMSRQPTDAVMRVYQNHAGKGWGAIAQELGIKPGSAEFHALKRGDLRFGTHPASQGDDDGLGHGHGKGKGKHGR
jgi:hypothetical protein